MPHRGNLSAAVLAALLGLAILFVICSFDYRLSHDMAETFGFVVAFAIFMMVWNARLFLDNHYYLLLGISYLFVGAIDYVHTLSFEGLFLGDSPDLHAQLWYAARFIQSAALLIAPAFADRRLKPSHAFAGNAVVAAFFLACILAWDLFPTVFRNGTEATWAHHAGVAAVTAAQAMAVALLFRKRKHFDGGVYRLLVWSILFSIATEVAGELYSDEIVYNNLFGHYLKVISFYLVYKAIIATGLFRPYDLLFRNLKRSEEGVRTERDELETRVEERTAELHASNLRLEKELAERRRAGEMRELILDLIQLTHSADNVREFLSSLASFLHERFGCEAIGIRFRRGADYPYIETRGFPQSFLREGMNLCPGGDAYDGEPSLECACGAVIAGRCEPSLPFFTPNGMFWTNSASDLLAASDAVKSLATRGRCIRQGYESIVLVPLRIGEVTHGLLQFNDRRKGLFQPYHLAQLERVAENVAGALARLLARESLQESEDRFRSLVENSPVQILIVADGRIVFRNQESEPSLGPIPAGTPFRDLGEVHVDDCPKFELLCEAMAAGTEKRHVLDLRFLSDGKESGDGSMKWFQIRTSPIEYRGGTATLINMFDITRVKDLEQIAASREKLASLGQLAAGIAHEIRNPLSGINVNISALEHLCRRFDGVAAEEEAKIGATVGKIRLASEKIAAVIRRVMEFSKSVPPKLGLVDVNGVIEGAIQMSATSLRRNGIEFHLILAPDLPRCLADFHLLGQVLLNLIANASLAMENVDGQRRLEITSFPEGDRVVVTVADSGPGIPPHLRSKVFDPFYTTRRDGHGIGLSFSRRVLMDHHGVLTVSASRWGGAEFRIEIPLEKTAA